MTRLCFHRCRDDMSQGWPGLIFLSSYAFLTSDEMQRAHISNVDETMYTTLCRFMNRHINGGETLSAGRVIAISGLSRRWQTTARSSRWRKTSPKEVQDVLLSYRRQLLQENHNHQIGADAGPVTLGVRLYSSYFPNGYDAISYGRGTWIFHMLRTMLRDAELKDAKSDPRAAKRAATGDEPFFRVLRKLRERYEGKYINNRIVQQVFEEELPDSLRSTDANRSTGSLTSG